MNTRRHRFSVTLWLAGLAALCAVPGVHAQRRPYIGYVYPAGGQIGTTFQVRLGGQDLEDLTSAVVTGSDVSVKVVDYFRRLNNQEMQLLNEQLRVLKRTAPAASTDPAMMMTGPAPAAGSTAPRVDPVLLARLEKRIADWVQVPACAAIANLVHLEVTVAATATPGARELRLVTARGISNPLVFQVGQHTEYVRPALSTAPIQILGKEAAALRKRPASEAETQVFLPCTVNGQMSSGSTHRYRFTAGRGQHLVLALQARQLIPFIADAVPGWFQPILALYDAHGREVAFADDYRFQPDPVISYVIPADGDYTAVVRDSLYRGREDFLYRLTLGELPFVTTIFPLGGQIGAALAPDLSGWNLAPGDVATLPSVTAPGIYPLTAQRLGFSANPLPYAFDTWPELREREPNSTRAEAQPVNLPVIINGRIDQPGDHDVFTFAGRAGQTIVAEVQARRLDSPLDSVLRLTDATGRILACNDDREDLAAGTNTHPADSYLTCTLPADGTYSLQIDDTAHQGGEAYAYRLRLGPPRPDFELRVVPSSASLPVNSTTTLTVYAVRHDGFTGPIKIALTQTPAGLSAAPVTLPAGQTSIRLTLKSDGRATPSPQPLAVAGTASVGGREVIHPAVPAEDRMQAFLWRHLVPATDLPVLVYRPNRLLPPAHPVPPRPVAAAAKPTSAMPPKFTKQQIVGRLRELKRLYEEGLLTDAFYLEKVAECDASSS